jgi:hypothetical protein
VVTSLRVLIGAAPTLPIAAASRKLRKLKTVACAALQAAPADLMPAHLVVVEY